MTQENSREERVREERMPQEPMQQGREPMQQGREPMPEDRQPMPQTAGDGMSEFRTRFEQLQAQFIDEPQGAVRSAESLVKEAVDHLMKGMSDNRGGNDTETLRVAMKRYRAVILSLTDNGDEERPTTR